MSGGILLDQFGTYQTRLHYDETTGNTVVENWQDCEAIIEANKAAQATAPGRFEKKPFFQRVASVPYGVIYAALAKYGIMPGDWMAWKKAEKMKFYRRIANDPDYKYVRTVTRNF